MFMFFSSNVTSIQLSKATYCHQYCSWETKTRMHNSVGTCEEILQGLTTEQQNLQWFCISIFKSFRLICMCWLRMALNSLIISLEIQETLRRQTLFTLSTNFTMAGDILSQVMLSDHIYQSLFFCFEPQKSVSFYHCSDVDCPFSVRRPLVTIRR